MNQDLPADIARLTSRYARDLAQLVPSDTLDARIARLVADSGDLHRAPPGRRRRHRPGLWTVAACLVLLAISAGIVIGMRLERARELAANDASFTDLPRLTTWTPEALSPWPMDSVAITIPAEYSPQGTLVAVNPQTQGHGQRYWIDVVVSNDGTVRIERILPADAPSQPRAEPHDHRNQIQ